MNRFSDDDNETSVSVAALRNSYGVFAILTNNQNILSRLIMYVYIHIQYSLYNVYIHEELTFHNLLR
jgi:hypothetical protein